MAKQTKMLLKEAIEKYAPKEDFVFIHRYNMPGYFKYKIEEISPKLLVSEIIVVNKHFGGVEYEYNATLFIIK